MHYKTSFPAFESVVKGLIKVQDRIVVKRGNLHIPRLYNRLNLLIVAAPLTMHALSSLFQLVTTI